MYDAAESLLAIANIIAEDFRDNKSIIDWLAGEFQRRTLKDNSIPVIRVYTPMCHKTGKDRRRGIKHRET